MVTVDALACELGQSLGQVLSHLEGLVDAGCLIQRHPHEGVRLERSGLSVWADYLHWVDRERHLPTTYEVYARIGSTQDAARRLIESKGHRADGAVVAADFQDAGRGRLGRRWLAPAGTAVLFSRCCVGPPGAAIPSTDRLVLAASVAVATAVERVAAPSGLDVTIKWPNDILAGDRKLAGILVERFRPRRPPTPDHLPVATLDLPVQAQAAVIGIGINVGLTPKLLPPELRERVTSLAMCNRHVDRLAILTESIWQLDAALATDAGELLRQWRRRSPIVNQRVRLKNSGRSIEGQVIDLDPSDGLIVRSDLGSIVHLPAATTTYA